MPAVAKRKITTTDTMKLKEPSGTIANQSYLGFKMSQKKSSDECHPMSRLLRRPGFCGHDPTWSPVGHSYGHGIENPWHSRTLPVKAKHKTNDRAAGQGDRGDGDGGLGRFSVDGSTFLPPFLWQNQPLYCKKSGSMMECVYIYMYTRRPGVLPRGLSCVCLEFI